jgi:hypothetical protein
MWFAEGPPASGSLQPSVQSMGHLAQPMQQSYRMQLLGSFDDAPAIVTCSQCGVTGQTYTFKVLTITILISVLLSHTGAMRTAGVSNTLCMLIAGKWLLCLVQCIVMSVHGVLAMCLAALLCWLMQGHSPQMQQLWYITWQACLGQMTLNIKYSEATADSCYASPSLALQTGPDPLHVLHLVLYDSKFCCIFCTIHLSSRSWTCI